MTPTRYCRQPELAVLRLSGADARAFLHAQTTQKLADLKPAETRLAAWLNARGRVLALFDVVPDGDDLLLVLPADNAADVATGLRRFVLRAKVRIDPDGQAVVYALTGAIDDWLASLSVMLPVGAVAVVNGAILARVGPGQVNVVGSGGLPAALFAGLDETTTDEAAMAAIAIGRPELPAVLRERYVPQMLNLERLGAISFTKGCYPGQEIVARTQNLGEVKRRLRRLRTPAGARPAAGDGILDAAGATVGEVNRAAATADGFELLAVVGVEAGPEGLRVAGDSRALEPSDGPGT